MSVEETTVAIEVPEMDAIFIVSDENWIACYGIREDTGKEKFIDTGIKGKSKLHFIKWVSRKYIMFSIEQLSKGEDRKPFGVPIKNRP